MNRYTITLQDRAGGSHRAVYDPHASTLRWSSGAPVDLAKIGMAPQIRDRDWQHAFAINGVQAPGRKSRAIRRLKIQLGLKCNYGCSYCLQRFQPETGGGAPDQVETFLRNLPLWFDGGEHGKGEGVRFEFWGGEPFAYWKTLKPLGRAIKATYPNASFAIVTNGSLITPEIVEWLDALGATVGISHDGPGQSARGPDPLDNRLQRRHLLALYDRLLSQGRVSFNVVLTDTNHDLRAIADWFAAKLEGRALSLTVEGVVIPYHAEGHECSLGNDERQAAFMRSILHAVVAGEGLAFQAVRRKLDDFFQSLATARPAHALGQKCGMDRDDTIAVTLDGKVITCQNVGPAGTAPNGASHEIGNVEALDAVRLASARHWSHREECRNCPVLQLCKGSCMYLEGRDRQQACDNEFAWNLGLFAAALFLLTDMVPVHIDGPMRRPPAESAAA